MYDALYDMIGAERVTRLIERNVIEIAPLAFMRGRSLNESFVILDEAQNTSVEQMNRITSYNVCYTKLLRSRRACLRACR